jgi:hypothetical protein
VPTAHFVFIATWDQTWESRGSRATLGMVDELLKVVHEFDPTLELKYNKFYIGMAKEGQAPQNFVIFARGRTSSFYRFGSSNQPRWNPSWKRAAWGCSNTTNGKGLIESGLASKT